MQKKTPALRYPVEHEVICSVINPLVKVASRVPTPVNPPRVDPEPPNQVDQSTNLIAYQYAHWPYLFPDTFHCFVILVKTIQPD